MRYKVNRAIERINAWEHAPGVYRYYADEVGEIYEVSLGDLDLLERMIRDSDSDDPYSEWCACAGREIPLRAERTDDTWTVVDPSGGRWWPEPALSAELEEATEPQDQIVRVCQREPMRGTWRS